MDTTSTSISQSCGVDAKEEASLTLPLPWFLNSKRHKKIKKSICYYGREWSAYFKEQSRQLFPWFEKASWDPRRDSYSRPSSHGCDDFFERRCWNERGFTEARAQNYTDNRRSLCPSRSTISDQVKSDRRPSHRAKCRLKLLAKSTNFWRYEFWMHSKKPGKPMKRLGWLMGIEPTTPRSTI